MLRMMGAWFTTAGYRVAGLVLQTVIVDAPLD